MENSRKTEGAGACVHCHLCRENCTFLKKYHIDIGNQKRLEELAYHCFLCGKCSQVCPIGIDGRNIILEMRQKKVESGKGKLKEKGYGLLLKEKQNYLYKNYRHITGNSVLFPGCNFPSFYPKTTKKLVSVLRYFGIGVVYDCCSKPVAELGLEESSKKTIQRIQQRLLQAGVTEVVMVCPNCYYFLKPSMDIKVVSIYEKLEELGIEKKIEEEGPIFPPCPDRKKQQWLEHMQPFLEGNMDIITDVQCCGLGGCASIKEPDLSKGMAGQFKDKNYELIYTYCASCAGSLSRNGCRNIHHVLADLMETEEMPDTAKSVINRIKTKID